MKLSKKESQAILDACELLETDKVMFSCYALEDAFCSKSLPTKYAKFYNGSLLYKWWPYDSKYKHERIMCLLFFREACK